MSIVNFMVAGALACSVLAADAPPAQKQEPATQSPSQVDSSPDHRPEAMQQALQRAARREWWRENGGKPAAASEPLSDEEFQRITQFMQTYSPNRWRMIDLMAPERKEKLMRNIRQQYQWMERLKTEDPDIYAIRLKRLPIEDEMFHLAWDARHEPADDTRSKLREQVRQFLDNCLAERKIRLERWKARLREGQQHIQKEESFIAETEANREARIDQGMEFINSEKIEVGKLKEWAGPMFNPRPLDFAPDRRATTAPADDQ